MLEKTRGEIMKTKFDSRNDFFWIFVILNEDIKEKLLGLALIGILLIT